jgi:hypothetical protein
VAAGSGTQLWIRATLAGGVQRLPDLQSLLQVSGLELGAPLAEEGASQQPGRLGIRRIKHAA